MEEGIGAKGSGSEVNGHSCFLGNIFAIKHSTTTSTINLLLIAHVAEEIHDTGVDDKQDTTTRAETQDLRGEALVQGSEALLLHNGAESRPGPVVLGDLARNLGGVLDARLDDVHGGVEDSTSDTTNATSDQVVAGLLVLVAGLDGRQLCANLEDTAKVTSVPQDVAPHG